MFVKVFCEFVLHSIVIKISKQSLSEEFIVKNLERLKIKDQSLVRLALKGG